MLSKHPEWENYKQAPIRGNWLIRWWKSRFRFVDYPFIMGYRGFGNQQSMVIQGQVFRGMALQKPRLRNTAWQNFMALIKLFLVRTIADVELKLSYGDNEFVIRADQDGFFEFNICNHGLPAGWHRMEIKLLDEVVEGQEEVVVKPEILIAQDFEYGLISDIDDTFLVSHVTKVFRKLYVLLTKDVETRRPFEGVVEFYNKLSRGKGGSKNPFFYVSSSEWNLYDFLINFIRFYKLPKGILQLKTLKDDVRDFFRSGYGSHEHKRIKIERIFAMYPQKQFILLGDNGQHDAYIYKKLSEDYPRQVKAIYIRAVKKSHSAKIDQLLEEIEKSNIPSLQFKHSAEAARHATERGYIQ